MSTTAWIVVIYFVISAIGSWASRKQKNARQPARRERSGRAVPSGQLEPLGSMESDPDPDPEPQPNRQTPDEIAAEIRRVMGLEREESRVEVIEEVYEEPVVSAPSHMFEPPVEPSQRGSLRDRLAAREASGHHDPGELETRHLATMGRDRRSSISDRDAPKDPGSARTRRAARSYIDISNMARALVTMEVLGPPKALRDDF